MLFHEDHTAWQSPAGQRLDEFARRLPRQPRLANLKLPDQ